MNNCAVATLLDQCAEELSNLESSVNQLGASHSLVPYLSRYGLIKACGTIEQAFKAIVADECSRRARKQIKNFLADKVTNSSSNPSIDNICKLLKSFDSFWKTEFKRSVSTHPNSSQLKDSLQSLVDARNEFAHGGNPHVSIGDVRQYFLDAQEILEKLDHVVSKKVKA